MVYCSIFAFAATRTIQVSRIWVREVIVFVIISSLSCSKSSLFFYLSILHKLACFLKYVWQCGCTSVSVFLQNTPDLNSVFLYLVTFFRNKGVRNLYFPIPSPHTNCILNRKYYHCVIRVCACLHLGAISGLYLACRCVLTVISSCKWQASFSTSGRRAGVHVSDLLSVCNFFYIGW